MHATSTGGFVFTRPDGSVIEPAPHVSAVTPADGEALKAMNRARGLDIDGDTLQTCTDRT